MQQMTVEEMLQRYPKSEVEKAIFDIKFSEHGIVYPKYVYVRLTIY